MQAAFLRTKLAVLDEWNARRREIAGQYAHLLADAYVGLPVVPEYAEPVWHLYVIRSKQRNALMDYLKRLGISTIIHYPIPPHQQPCYQDFHHLSLPVAEILAGEVLSLPMSPALQPDQIDHLTKSVLGFKHTNL